MPNDELLYLYLDGSTPPSNEEVRDINSLLKALNPYAKKVSAQEVGECCRNNIVIVCTCKFRIVGMARLVIIVDFGSIHGKIEDVVVATDMRGKGIASEMLRQLMAKAKMMGMNRLELTCNNERKEALNLYKSFGFQEISTNVLVIKIE